MKKSLLLFLIIISPLFLVAQNLQTVTDNGNTTDNHVEITSNKGLGIVNSAITSGSNSWKIGQHGGQTQYMRIVPFSTIDGTYQWGHDFYFDFTNSLWGFDGKVYLEDNLGIGTSDPVEKLDVIGTATISGDIGVPTTNYYNTGSHTLELQNEDGGEVVLSFHRKGFNSATIVAPTLGGLSLQGNGKNDDSHLYISNEGAIGIGTTSPTEDLDMKGTAILRHSKAEGLRFSYEGASSGGFQSIGSNANGDLILSSYGTVEGNEHLVITQTKNVGIGTTDPSEKLEVAGTIYSNEVRVDIDAGTGPDYVFEPTYNLRTLEETEAYIQANKHLPEIPSAKEMEANGVQLGEMNMLLLKKIEEMTLYQIELLERVKKLEKALEEKVD